MSNSRMGAANLREPSSGRTRGAAPATGIFGADWHKWRGATLSVALEGAPPFLARLDAVGVGTGVGVCLDASLRAATHDCLDASLRLATLTVLDAQGRPTEVREVPWPPEGEV